MNKNSQDDAVVAGKDMNLSRFNWSNDRIIELRSCLSNLLLFNEKEISEINPQELFEVCSKLISSIPLAGALITPENTHFILRARPNYNNQIFTDEEEISYNSRETDKIQLGRFNFPKQSIFYGTLPSDHQESFVTCASLESCKEIVSDKNEELFQYLTFGHFTIHSPFHVINLCFEDQALNAHSGLNAIVQLNIKEITEGLTKSSSQLIIDFWKTISDLAAKSDPSEQHYAITSTLFFAIRDYYIRVMNFPINGLIYPSCMVHGDAINIALFPEVVDKHMRLDKVFMYKYSRRQNGLKNYTSGLCSLISEVKNKKFEIKGLLNGYSFY